jgi:hypothetical protein
MVAALIAARKVNAIDLNLTTLANSELVASP